MLSDTELKKPFLDNGRGISVPELIIAEQHDQVYHVWAERGVRNLRVAHVDFHCDMRGLVVDRKQQRAFRKAEHEAGFVDLGNWLGHAIMNGMVTDLLWIHDPFGGRMYDDGATVGYETDFLARWHDWQHRRRDGDDVPIAYKEIPLTDWKGPRSGEHLDIDWDALACTDYSLDYTKQLIDMFLDRDFSFIPETTFLVFSPDYSHPDRDLFEAFAEQLAAKFNADIKRLPMPEMKASLSDAEPGLLTNVKAAAKQRVRHYFPGGGRRVKRSVIKSTRYFQSRYDLQNPGP